MPHRIRVTMTIAIGLEFIDIEMVIATQPSEGLLLGSLTLKQTINLRAVAGAENHQLGDTVLGMRIPEGIEHLLTSDRDFLSHHQGS